MDDFARYWLHQKMLYLVLMHFIVDLARAAWLWEQIFYFTPVTVEADILSSSIVFLTLYIYFYNFVLFAATFFNLQQLYFICSNFLICSMSFVGHRIKQNVLRKKKVQCLNRRSLKFAQDAKLASSQTNLRLWLIKSDGTN